MAHILTLDQSTSATKALIHDDTGRLIDKVSLDHRQIYPQPGWVEHDAEEIWQNTLSALKTVLRQNPDVNPACLSITNQRETIVVFEKGSGRPLYHALVWQCRRGDAKCAQLTEGRHAERVRSKTGLKIDSYFSASKLNWLMENKPAIAEALETGQALIGTIDTYLIYRLTGGRVHATDYTNASRTLLFNIKDLTWDQDLCNLFQVPISSLPEVRDCSAQYGQTTLNGYLPTPLPICGVMGDSQAALFGQRCFETGMAKVTIGSGSSLLLNIGSDLRFTESGAVSTIAWVIDGRPTYAFEGIINYSAATLAWLQNQLGLFDHPDQIEPLAASVPDNGGVYLVPAFGGLSAPYWQPQAKAAIVGLTAHSHKGHVVRAAVESIAYQIRDVLDMMRQETNLTLTQIQADGGAAHNQFLLQFIADQANLTTAASKTTELSPLGAALAGMLGMKIHPNLEALATLPQERTTFTPKMARKEVEQLHEGWRDAVKRVL